MEAPKLTRTQAHNKARRLSGRKAVTTTATCSYRKCKASVGATGYEYRSAQAVFINGAWGVMQTTRSLITWATPRVPASCGHELRYLVVGEVVKA